MTETEGARDEGLDTNTIVEALDGLVELLKRIPGAERYLRDVDVLKQLLLKRRPPRIAVVGRRGAGKSAIANAIFGSHFLETGSVDVRANEIWQHLAVDGRKLEWLDTSGIGAGGIAADRLAHLKELVAREAPDAIIFACKAKEVDAEIDHTLAQFKSILSIFGEGDAAAKVIVALTQCDELPPARSKDLPYPESKLTEISVVTARLEEHLARHDVARYRTVPISTLMEFDQNGTMTWDGRYNIGELERAIFQVLPVNASLEAARLFERFREARRTLAVRLVKLASSAAFGVGFLPVPGSDIVPLYGLQATLVTAIAYLSGRKLGVSAAREWVAALGGVALLGLALREGFRQLLKFVPLAGNTAAAGIAAAATHSLGMSAIAYFLDGKSDAEARQTFDAGRSREWKNGDDAPAA